MLRVLEAGKEIEQAQTEFAQRFKRLSARPIAATVGFQGGNLAANLYWSEKLHVWYAQDTAGNRYWNAFGTQEAREGRNHTITCEINFPLNGADRRIAGAFAREVSGGIFVLHSGRIGGGKAGVGKALFEANYKGKQVSARFGPTECEVFLVGALSSKRLPEQVAHFVHEVQRVKGLMPQSHIPRQRAPLKPRFGFSPEFAGRKRYRVAPTVEAECDHGLIAGELERVLTAEGLQCANDQFRDLYVIEKSGNVRTLFEIKTDVSRQSLYAAVGQLLLNSAASTGIRNLVLVVPTGLSREVESTLSQLKIRVLPYRWKGHSVEFPLLPRLLRDSRM